MRTSRFAAHVAAVALLSALPAFAGTETVRVTKAMDDKAIVTRSNGDSYLIEKGTGCLSLWRYEGKTVLIVSPGLFLGVGSKLLIPDLDQECRIWNSELLSVPSTPQPSVRPSPPPPTPPTSSALEPSALATIQKALRLAGYDPGPADGTLNPQAAAALDKCRTSKGHPRTEDGLRKTLTALAVDVASTHPNDKAALQVSVDLITVVCTCPRGSGTAAPPAPRPRSSDCEDGHWVQSVSSGGEIVKLEDGSIWEISAIDRIDTSLWLVTEEITVCSGRLINTDTGDAVDATRLK